MVPYLRKPAPGGPRYARRVEAAVPLLGGLALLGANHLSVRLGFGLHGEAVVIGAFLVVVGLVWVVSPRVLGALDGSDLSVLRVVALTVFFGGAGLAAAFGLARWYGEPLF